MRVKIPQKSNVPLFSINSWSLYFPNADNFTAAMIEIIQRIIEKPNVSGIKIIWWIIE